MSDVALIVEVLARRVVAVVVLAVVLTVTPLTESQAQEVAGDVAPSAGLPALEPPAEIEPRDPTFFPLPLVQAFSLGGSITSMISGGFSIAHGIQQGKLLSEIVNTLIEINTKVDQLNVKMDELTKMMITMQDTINLKFDEVLNLNRQTQLTVTQNKINEAYAEIFGGYAALSLESNLDTARIQQKVAEVCGKWELEGNNGFYESMRLYNTIMTGSDMNTPAIESLTSLLITRMTLANENSRITASQAMKALSSYFAQHFSIQGKGVLCVREIVYANTTRTLAENDKIFNDYLSWTIQGDFWASQLALYHKCVGRIVAVNMDFSSQANRGPVPLFKDVKNSAGEVIFSHDIAENIYATAELLSCVLLPSACQPGLYAQVIGDPSILPDSGLAVSLSGGAAMTPMEPAPVAIPTAPYLAWWGSPSWSSGINMAMQFSMNESRYYYHATDPGDWTVSAGDASVPLATRPVKVEWYDKTTGALATSDTMDENKLLFGAALLPINRLQPDIAWSLPVVQHIGGADPSITFAYDGNSVSSILTNSKSLWYILRGYDVTSSVRKDRWWWDVSKTASQEIRNMGPTCKLSFGAKVSMKVRAPRNPWPDGPAMWFKTYHLGIGLGWWKPPYTSDNTKIQRWSAEKEYVKGLSNFWGEMGWDPPTTPNSPLGLPLKKNDTVKIFMHFQIDGNWSSKRFKNTYLCCAYGPSNNWKPYSDFETWSYPGPTFAFTSMASNTPQGASASCAFGVLPSKAGYPGVQGDGDDGTTTDSCFFITFDPLKAKASMATMDYAIPDTWKLLDTGCFSLSEDASSILYFDEESRSFSHCQFPSQPQSAAAEGAKKAGEAGSVSFSSIAGLTLPEGMSYIATGDFNGDGQDDLLVGNPDTGEYQVCIISQSALAETGPLAYDISKGKPTFHVADFNGDGTDDILACFESTGSYHISLMNGATVSDSGWLDAAGLRLMAVADFDGDGMSELLGTDTVSGALTMMYCDGLDVVGFETVKLDGDPSKKGFSIAQLGDFNGDGKTDILWSKTGKKGVELFVSYMDGGHSLVKKQARSGPVKLALPAGSVFY